MLESIEPSERSTKGILGKMKKSYAFTASETELLYYTIGEHLEETVTKYPETEALVATWRNERYTYREQVFLFK